MKKTKAGRGAGECRWCGIQGRPCFSRDLSKAGSRTCECLEEEPSRQRVQQAQRPCGRSSLDIFKDARDASRLSGAGGVTGEQCTQGFREQLWVLFQV